MKNKNTTALLITSALAGGAAHGAIVYTSYNQTIVGNTGATAFDVTPDFSSHFSLLYQDSNSQKPEVRGDGVNSFVLARTWQNTNNMDLNHRTYGGLPLAQTGVLVDGQMLDVNPVKQQNGITNLVVQNNGYFYGRPDNTDADTGGGGTINDIGDWGSSTTSSGYVGLVMVNGGVTNFGWAHFVWNDPSGSSTAAAQLTLVDFAYESTPNQGILTGAGSPTPPSIISAPGSVTTYAGASFSLPAAADNAMGYRWQAGAVGSGIYTNLSDTGNFSGSTASSLVIHSATPANTADYILIATNANGAVTSSPPATVTILTPGSTPTTAAGWFNAFQGQTDLNYAGARRNVSYQASNGKVYWLYDDMAQGTMDPSTHAFLAQPLQVDNKIMLASGDMRVPTDRAATTAASVPTGAYYYEFHDMFEANGYAYIVIQELGAAFQFGALGGTLAKYQISTNGLLTFVGLIATPASGVTSDTNRTSIQWASSAVVQNGYVYFFGENSDGAGTYLARVTTANVETPGAWTYWNGSGWDVQITNCVPVSTNSLGVVRLYQGDWVTINKVGGQFGTDTYAYAAAQPQGPYTSQYLFTDPTDTIQSDHGLVGITTNSATGAQEYYVSVIPSLHPEYPLDSGKLLVGIDYWDGSGITWTYNAGDAGLFKPRFYEVTLTNLPVPNVELNIQKAGSNVVLSWPTGTLLEAPSLSGPWTTNSATSPYTNLPVGSQKFYRVLVQ